MNKLIGAYYIKKTNKWLSSIKVKGKSVFLGYYDTQQEAHLVFNEYKKSIQVPKELIPDGMKKCGSCKTIKNLKDFSNLKRSKDGKYCWCKECKYKNYIQRYKEKSKIKRNEYNKKYLNEKRKTDTIFKIKSTLRSRLKRLLKRNTKSSIHLEKLGCNINQLKLYLESKFYPNPQTGTPMTWDNYGKSHNHWQIDHIIEIHSVDLTIPKNQDLIFHYTNLQPLWFSDHVIKTNDNRKY